jgi:phi13 family phage major tail protein
MPENRVVFGLKNCHYAVITEDADGTYTYGVPVAIEGMTALELATKGSQDDFYADDVLYYTSVTNQGYEAKLTVANISRQFRIDVLGETLDTTDSVLTENSFNRTNQIALLFEFDGDIKATRHAVYNCTVSRPNLTSETKADKVSIKTQELTMTAAPRPYDGIVKRSTTGDTPDTVYDAWYTAVYDPATAAPAP